MELARGAPPPVLPARQHVGEGHMRPLPHRLGLLAALLCAAWLIPLGLNLLRLDIIELVVLLLAIASVLRSGTNVVDRLMIAGCLLAAGFLVLGWLFSVWPWRLAPVLVGGTLGSGVVLAGWLAGRRPRLPRRVLGSDAVVLGSGLFAFWAAYSPVAHLAAEKRLMFSASTTDRFDNFARFDTILRLGGYPFLQQRQAQISLKGPIEVNYPAGWHFLAAVFDTFSRSAAGTGLALQEYSRYFSYVLAAYTFLVVAIVWAARWIAGPRVTGWRSVVVCSAVAGLVIGGIFAQLIRVGAEAQCLGLAFFAIAVAVNARPPHVVREQVLVSAALLIAVTYCYNPYLPIVGLGLVLASIVYFSRLRRHWRFSAAVLGGGSAIAVLPSILTAVSASGSTATTQLLASRGWIVAAPARPYICVAVVTLSAVAVCLMWRPALSRAMAGQLFAAAAAMVVFAAYQLHAAGHIRYYYYKLELAGYVACLVGLGLLGVILHRVRAPITMLRPTGRLSWRLLEIPVAVIGGTAVLLAMVGAQPRSPAAGAPPIWGGTSLQRWNAAQTGASWAYRSFAALADAHLLGDGVPTLVVTGKFKYDWNDSYLASVLNRDMGEMLLPMRNLVSQSFYFGPTNARTISLEIAAVRSALFEIPAPVRLVVPSRSFAKKVRVMLASNPRLKHTMIAVVPSLG